MNPKSKRPSDSDLRSSRMHYYRSSVALKNDDIMIIPCIYLSLAVRVL